MSAQDPTHGHEQSEPAPAQQSPQTTTAPADPAPGSVGPGTSDPTWTERLMARVATANPVWLREMKQSARLTRTPMILAAITSLMALSICTVGGIGASSWEPAEVGAVLFQVFFSLAFAVVSWVGPGVGALTVASEKSGRTWEALLLTSLSTRRIARGKFAAAYTYVAMYVVMLAPLGGVSFLFGGVSAVEVVLAYLLLFAFVAVAIGFGLSVSSALSSPVLAMLLTVPLAVMVSTAVFFGLGVGLSYGANELWPSVVEGTPVWLPAALTRADFDWLYVACLLYTPGALLFTTTWFFYEVTAANMGQASDDRISGLRRWFLLTAPLLLGVFLLPRFLMTGRNDAFGAILVAMLGVFLHGLFGLLLFAGDSLAPSARVRARFDRLQAGKLRRLLGPGIDKSGLMIVVFACALLGLLLGGGILQELDTQRALGTPRNSELEALFVSAGYALAFLTCCAGFLVYTRAHSRNGTAPRVLMLLLWFATFAGPWIMMAIGGAMADRTEDALWLAAPSPTFVFVVLDRLLSHSPKADTGLLTSALAICACVYSLLGMLLWAAGNRRLRRSRAPSAPLPTPLQQD